MTEFTPLFDPADRRSMRVAALMSGSGTNLIRLIEASRSLPQPAYEVVVIFTDTLGSKACEIGGRYGIPVVCDDILAFYSSKGLAGKKDLSLRPDYDQRVRDRLAPFKADLVVLAGYMSILTDTFLDAYAGRIVNVHPADLSLMKDGRRCFTGDRAVRDCILSGLKYLHSSTHLVRREVDYGEILLISRPLAVELPEGTSLDDLRRRENRKLLKTICGEHQERLKRSGDWVVLPLTVEWIANGRFGTDAAGTITLDGIARPEGVRLAEMG